MSFDARTNQLFPTREKCVSDEHMLALSDRQLLDLSISTDHVDEDISWMHRINLFYMSPVTIFVLDAILQFTENAVFMIFLLSTELHRSQVRQRLTCSLLFPMRRRPRKRSGLVCSCSFFFSMIKSGAILLSCGAAFLDRIRDGSRPALGSDH